MLRLLVVLFLAASLTACASRERVILLPGPDGKVGKVVVESRSGQTLLDSAYAAADVSGAKLEARQLSEAEVRQRYGSALDAVPKRPISFLLFFLFDKAQMTPESRATLAGILTEYSSRPAPEVLVIGHTDKAGESQYNDDLSRRRAEVVRDLLIREGVPKGSIEIQWRGDREPMPSTGRTDQRNRRVEVKIR